MGKGVDWWTLGILTFELMAGHAPFEANDPMETYQKIVRGMLKLEMRIINRFSK
jgi:protein kinase A